MGGLIGSAPSAQTTQSPTIDPTQQALLSSLAGNLGNQGPGGAYSYGQFAGQEAGTQYAAPLSGLQSSSLGGIQNLVNAFGARPISGSPNNAGALNTATSYAQNLAGTPPISMIDPTQAFQQGVVQPVTQDFNSYVIPSIAGRYGQGAGGAYSSDALGARQQAGTNLARTLAQSGSQFTLAADQANQAAQGQNAQLQLSAANSIPGLVAAPLGLDTAQEGLLTGGLQAGAVPQATQQTQIQGQEGDYQNMIQQIMQRLQDALGLGTAQTQQTQTVVNPGQTGLLPALASAFAGGAGRSIFGAGGLLGS